jgi:L-lactate dehydrogenase (cytochrome)
MKPREILRLVSLRPPSRSAARRRLDRAHTIGDLRASAMRRLPRPVFDYVEGGADEERSLRRNLDAFARWEFVPLNPRDVSHVSITSELFGRTASLPLLCAPTGYTRMMHPGGEPAVARAAARAGLPYALSTVASSSIEEVASTGHPDLWFQLYVWRDRGLTADLIERAWAAGYRVLEVSVDAPVAGYRIRDVRNGLTIPPRLSTRTLVEIAAKPAYWVDVLRHPPIRFANSPSGVEGGITIENMTALFEPALSWSDVAAVRERWRGALVIKGSFDSEGAREAVASGADALHLSNHGGRQLDRVVPPIELLPEVREVVGDETTIVLDSGIRSGADLAVALALGADAGAVGRVYLYGLMAGGQQGVEHALGLLAAEFRRTLQLLGVASVAELRRLGTRVVRRTASSGRHAVA